MRCFGADRNTRLGTFVVNSVGGESVKAFIPPPRPAVDLTSLVDVLDRATVALGRLDGVTTVLPAPPLFICMFEKKLCCHPRSRERNRRYPTCAGTTAWKAFGPND
jgi:hypothetical protein